MDPMNRRNLTRFMDAIELGTVPLADAFPIAENQDPLLMYFLLRYLREVHATSEGGGPGGRLIEFLSTYPSISKMTKAPKDDPMIEWFEDTHSMREFSRDREKFLDTIIDKFEG